MTGKLFSETLTATEIMAMTPARAKETLELDRAALILANAPPTRCPTRKEQAALRLVLKDPNGRAIVAAYWCRLRGASPARVQHLIYYWGMAPAERAKRNRRQAERRRAQRAALIASYKAEAATMAAIEREDADANTAAAAERQAWMERPSLWRRIINWF